MNYITCRGNWDKRAIIIMIKTSNICTLCPAEDTSVYDYEQLIVHLNDDHKIVQKHVFIIAIWLCVRRKN